MPLAHDLDGDEIAILRRAFVARCDASSPRSDVLLVDRHEPAAAARMPREKSRAPAFSRAARSLTTRAGVGGFAGLPRPGTNSARMQGAVAKARRGARRLLPGLAQ